MWLLGLRYPSFVGQWYKHVEILIACVFSVAELGDFEEEEHTPAFISEFRFMPNQSEDMEVEVFNKYKSLR